jgi:hypothetical protein
MKKILFFFILCAFLSLILFSSCASQKLVEGKTVSGSPAHDRIFPDGTYQHKVTLTLKRPAPGQSKAGKFDFTGIVQMDPAAIHIAVLSYFGTTAFKIAENLKTGEIKMDVYIDQLKKFEPRLKEYYLILREILLAKRSRAEGLQENAHFRITEFDKNGIPTAFSIEHPDFDVSVKVVGYEIK